MTCELELLSNQLETLDFISLVDSKSVDEILLDFAKASDFISHRMLVHKISDLESLMRWQNCSRTF